MTTSPECFGPDQLRHVVPPSATSLCVFATHDESGGPFDAYVIEYARQLASHYEKLVIVSNPRAGETGARLPDGTRVCFVPNGGLDFGMWARVLKNLDRPGLQRLGLVNDSAMLVGDVAGCFDKARDSNWEFWGVVESEEIRKHVQSWFLVAEGTRTVRRVLDFFRELDMPWLLAAPKGDIVEQCEVGLSQHVAKITGIHGVYSMADVLGVTSARANAPPNPSYWYWDALLRLGCPCLKKKRARL